ncbi:hypothetical protein Tco_1292511 [Tanacetum coccineum]
MPPKSAPLTQAAIRRMIKESVDAAIAAERARHANAGNDARGSRLVRCQDVIPVVRKKVKFAATTLQGPALTWWNAKVAIMGLETVNQMPWTKMKQLMTTEFCPIEELQRMEHGLWNLKGEVNSSKPANLNEAVCMAHKLMEQKLQARDERILEGKKRKGESFHSGNSSAEYGVSTSIGYSVEDVSLTCDTPLEVFNNEVNRLSRMDNDLFTYEVKVANIPCDSEMDNDSEDEADDDMGYDLSDVAFTEWLGSKNFKCKTMDHYTMNALWIYWVRGDDEVELTDEEYSDDKDEVVEVFRIDTKFI